MWQNSHAPRCCSVILVKPQNNTAFPAGWVSYCAIESFGSICVSLFWAFVNSSMNVEGAKSAYGLIIAGANLGSIMGPTIATTKVRLLERNVSVDRNDDCHGDEGRNADHRGVCLAGHLLATSHPRAYSYRTLATKSHHSCRLNLRPQNASYDALVAEYNFKDIER